MVPQRTRLAFLLSVLLWSCSSGACTLEGRSEAPKVIWPADEWQTSSPEKQAMDSDLLDQMMELIDEREAPIDSVLVIRHGYLVYEEYRRNWKETSRHHIQSATKSFTSTLVGIAINEGFIEGVDQPLMDFYPEREVANLDSRKQAITIKDLLTMSEGMDWHEVDLPYDDPDNSLGQMWRRADAIQHVLDQPMARNPGEAWNYNSGTSMLLGNIVEQAAGQDILSFARKYLFDPLGIGDVSWDKADASHYHTDGGLYMTPRDMARLGYLMLREGVWEGEQILPPEWVSQASTAHFQTPTGMGYGYQWWTTPQFEIYSARGHYDQAIYVIPEADLVVVFTANVPDESIHPEDGLLIRNILKACKDLPDDFTRRSYADHGFEFEYGGEFTPYVIPGSQSGMGSDSSGSVQFNSLSYPIELILVSWDDTLAGGDPEAILREYFEVLSSQEGMGLEAGELSSLSIGGRSVTTQGISLAVQGLQLSGLSGVWACGSSERGYLVTYLSDADERSFPREARFQEIFASFACQE